MADGLTGTSFSCSVHRCSVKGGDKLMISSSCSLPDQEFYVMLTGAQGSNKVCAERVGPTCLTITLPGHKTAETVALSLHTTSNDSALFTTQFSYVNDHTLFLDNLLQSVRENGQLTALSLPPLSSPEALRLFDQSLVAALRDMTLPPGWSLVERSDSQRETLLHFAVRHGLNSLSEYLLSLPGAAKAILLPDQREQLPIDIARAQGNEGLAQLLMLYMNEVESNGVGKESPLESPQHTSIRKRAHAQVAQDLEKFKMINSQWTNRVKRLKHNSLSNLDSPPSSLTNGSTPSHSSTRHIPTVTRRRSSVSAMEVDGMQFVPATPIEAVQVNTRDPGLAAMERSRKTSWSRVVGSSDCRSMGTGLNELDRISAEEAIQERLVHVKTELVQLDHKRQDPSYSNHHLKLDESQLEVMYRLSHSCPSLNEDDVYESDGPNAFLSAATSPGGRTASPLSPQSPQSSSQEEIDSSKSQATDHANSVNSNKTVCRQTCSESELLERDRLSVPNYSTPCANSQSTGTLGTVNVEESIVEHRQLTQADSPVSSELTVRSEDDFVMISSSNVSKENSPTHARTADNALTPVDVPSDTREIRIPTPLLSMGRFKHHRRSLSSSEVEMSSISTLTGGEVPPPSSAGWNTPPAHISSIEEDRLSALADTDERSRASSLITNDTCSVQESDTSDEECPSAKETVSTTSLDPLTSAASDSLSNEAKEATDSVPAVQMRSSYKREQLKALQPNRFSADYIFNDHQLEGTHKQRNKSSNLSDALTCSEEVLLDSTFKSPVLLESNEVFSNSTELSPSDIDVSFKSGENSLEASQSSVFFKPTGSPKTIKKRKASKSPLFPRRAHDKLEDRGLTKEKIGPTISALKDLMRPSLNQPLSDGEEPNDRKFVFGAQSDTLELTQMEDGQLKSSSAPRAPLETPPNEIEDGECTSLDFVPSSPLIRDARKTTPSPLTVERARSSPVEREKFSHEHQREKSSSSPSPVPPTLEEPSNDERSKTVQSPISKASSECNIRGVHFSDQSPLPPPQDEGAPSKEKEKLKWSKIFGKKLGIKEQSKSQETETEGQSKQGRPKSGKRHHKYEEVVVLKYCTPTEYESDKSVPLNRSASLQVGMDNIGAEQAPPPPYHHSRSTSVQVNEHPKLHPLTKRQSEHALSSPSKKSESTSGLSTLEEIPNDSNSPSPHLVPTSPHVGPPSGDSENEQEEISIVKSLSVSHPVLEIPEEFSWDRTIDRRLYRKLNKAERERQAILHELLQTEKNHFRVLHVLKLIFRQQMHKLVSNEMMEQLFPELDNLIEISDGFVKRLESKKRNTDDIMIDDLSDVLLEQFSGESRAQMLRSFGNFCSGHLNAAEIYKEHLKKKSFARLMKQLHSLKECQRLTLPDYYLAVSQRLSKLLTLLKRLAKKSESLKLDHAPRVRESLVNLEELVTAVDQTVENNKMRMEVEAIQSRLETPRSTKFKDRRERLNFSLTAQDRRLRKRGMAGWKGHGKDVSVHLILVTDMVVLLTERDQKYHLASLLDHKPPVIRLYDLHVRVNVSVKTGVQLLLLEKGNSPEMFRLEFMNKKQARE